MPTTLSRRAPVSPSTLTRRIKPGFNTMDIITTGFWDDSQPWQDNKIWFDTGSSGTSLSRRPSI